jgi:hypothetical protein
MAVRPVDNCVHSFLEGPAVGGPRCAQGQKQATKTALFHAERGGKMPSGAEKTAKKSRNLSKNAKTRISGIFASRGVIDSK